MKGVQTRVCVCVCVCACVCVYKQKFCKENQAILPKPNFYCQRTCTPGAPPPRSAPAGLTVILVVTRMFSLPWAVTAQRRPGSYSSDNNDFYLGGDDDGDVQRENSPAYNANSPEEVREARTHTHTHTHTHTEPTMPIPPRRWVGHAHTHTNTHTHLRAHTHTHTHTHTQTCAQTKKLDPTNAQLQFD